MTQFKEILCPIDFSDFSRHALDHAAALAKSYKARLTVLHVLPNPPVMDVPPISMEDKDRVRSTDAMTRFTSHVPPEVTKDLRIQEAPDVHQEILAQAAATNADLLVIGSHGRSGFQRLLLGSVTEKILRKAPCPMLVVPRRASDRPPDEPLQFSRILCPVDFSDGSLRALKYAMTLARDAGAQLLMLHAIEVPPELQEFPVSAAFDVESVRAAAEADALRRLRGLVPGAEPSSRRIETAVREGAAYREILKVASEHDSDLIVMGVQGRGAIDLMVFGSNTARVARAATCPILILHKL